MSILLDGTTGISASGNITGANFLTTGLVSATGNVTGNNFSINGNVLTALPVTGNITGGNLLTAGLITATGNITGGNLLTAGLISATGNITGGNVLGGANVNATTHTGTTVSVTGNIDGGNLRTAGLITATGNITGANIIINGTAAAGSAVLIVSGNIQTSTANATSNIGNVANYFNVIHGKSTTAQYADLAELYIADAEYVPGTVLDFGGVNEVTLSSVASSTRVAGVVSANPAHLMNGMMKADITVPVALTGRVHTQVVGMVRKGDMMVSAGNGQAMASASPIIGSVLGKSLEDFDGQQGLIEIVVGRL